MRHVIILVPTCCLLSLPGCGGSEDPQQVVSKLRVLGVRADSPDVTAVLPKNGLPSFTPAAVKLDALVADPKGGGRPVSLSWSACPVFDPEASTNLDCGGANGLPLNDATFRPLGYVSWLLRRPGFDIARLEAAGGVSSISMTSGIPLFMWLAVRAGDDTAVALKRVTLVGTAERNRNPVLEGVTAEGVPFGPGVSFKAGREFKFTPQVAPPSFEAYAGGTSGKTMTETPVVMWYSSDGKFSDLNTYPPKFPDNTWVSPALAAGETERLVDFWIVLLDLRGGIDWLEVKGVRVVP